MTSSSSLYGSVSTQNVSSTNSTSLYGEAGTPIPDSSGNVVVRGDLLVLSGNILTTATTGNIFPANATTINLGGAATAVNIGASTGTTTINNTLNAADAEFGNITIAVADDNTISTTTGNLILDAATNTVQVSADLTIDGTNVNLAQGTSFKYSENGNRANRPEVQSTTGNSSGFRVLAPNATTSASSSLNLIGSNDIDNGSFMGLGVTGSTTNPFAIRTGKYTGGVLGSSGKSINFIDNATIYASINPAGPTIGTDLTTKDYVDSFPANITYTIDASSTTGGANFNLVSSDAVTDTIKFASGTGITISRTDANTITITNNDPGSAGVTSITGTANQVIASASTGAITLSTPQDIATTSNVTFADITATDDLTVQGNNVNLAQATTIGYDENNNRANRPQVQSTTGNSSGFRVLGPNATTSSSSNLAIFGSNDIDNSQLIAIRASQSSTIPFSISSGVYTAGVFGASGKVININDGNTTYATLNPSGPTNPSDLATKSYVDAQELNTTYTIDATSTTGGANFNLTGSDASVDTIKFASAGATTVSRTDANTIQISSTDTNTTYDFNATSTTGGANLNLVGSDSSTDTVKLTNGGHITATYTSGTEVTLGSDATDANTVSTIVARDSSGNFSAGTISLAGNLVATKGVYAKGIMDATYTDGIVLDYTTGNGRISVGSADTLSFYNGGVASTLLGQFSTTGSLAITNDLDVKGGDITNSTGALQIATTSNGALTLAPNGTGNVAVSVGNGQNLTNTRNYVLGTIRNSTTASIGDIWALNSTGPAGPLRGISLDNSADTAKGPGTVLRSFSGGAATGQRGRVVFEKARGTSASPTANQAGDLLGSVDATGYTSTGWLNDNIAAVVPGSFALVASENWVSNTALGTTATLSLAPTATTITSAANLVPVITANPQSFAARSDSFTLSQGKTGTTTFATFNNTSTTLAASGTTYASISGTGNTFTNTGISNFIRQGTVNATQPALLVRYSRTDTTGSNDGDGVDFRLGTGGTSTTNNIARFDAQYKTSGLHQVGISVSTDSFAADTDTVYRAQADQTTLRTTPAGGGTAADTLTLTQLATTLKSDSLTLQNAAGTNLIGNNITYNRVYGQFQYNTTVSPVAANTAYVFPLGTTDFANITTVGSTSRLIPGAAGKYNFQFSVQVVNGDNGQDHTAYIWLRKNGTDVPGSMGRVTVVKGAGDIAAWNYVVDPGNSTDYFELAYAVDDTQVTFPAYTATAFGPSTATLITTLTPIGA